MNRPAELPSRQLYSLCHGDHVLDQVAATARWLPYSHVMDNEWVTRRTLLFTIDPLPFQFIGSAALYLLILIWPLPKDE